MEAVSSQPVSPNVLRARARAGDRTCAKDLRDRSKSVSVKRNSRSLTHALFKRVLRSEIAQRRCVGPDATPHDLGDNPIRSEFNYTLENGQRTKLEETFYFDHDGDGGQTTPDVAKTTTYDWVYDANDRLLSETIDHHDDALDRSESFVMDLFGNRTARTINYVDPTEVDQAFAYSYDDNDRLVNETLDDGADSTVDKTTQYTWDSTQQTAKEIFTGDSTAPANLVSSQSFTYDLQGRLAEVITSPETGPATKVTYSYDSSGIRVSSSQFTDANSNDVFETSELEHTIDYLVDHRNHTGYAQTIAETITDGNGNNVSHTTYTFGTDELSQTTYTPDPATAEAWLAEAMHFFGHDAHGSVRILLDVLGEIAQTFTYAAYGELLAIYDATGALVGTLGAADTSAALTTLLYSGESFDSRIGQQYLRARWYNTAAGRFARLDPYFGTLTDPLSFNKFNYTHSNPVTNSDPSGLLSLSGLAIGGGIFGAIAGGTHGAILGAKHGIKSAIYRGLTGALFGGIIGAGAGALIGAGGVGLAFFARSLGFYLAPKTAIFGLFTAAGLTGIGAGVQEVRNAQDPFDRAAGMTTILFSVLGTAFAGRATYKSLPDTWIPWNTRTYYHGRTYLEAVEAIEQQRFNLTRLAQDQSGATNDLGPGIYLTESRATALEFARGHGAFGRRGGPAIIVIEITNGKWWALRMFNGAIERVPISDMEGHFQSFVPEAGAARLNQYAVFKME